MRVPKQQRCGATGKGAGALGHRAQDHRSFSGGKRVGAGHQKAAACARAGSASAAGHAQHQNSERKRVGVCTQVRSILYYIHTSSLTQKTFSSKNQPIGTNLSTFTLSAVAPDSQHWHQRSEAFEPSPSTHTLFPSAPTKWRTRTRNEPKGAGRHKIPEAPPEAGSHAEGPKN